MITEEEYIYSINPEIIKDLINAVFKDEKVDEILSITTNYQEDEVLYKIQGVTSKFRIFGLSLCMNGNKEEK